MKSWNVLQSLRCAGTYHVTVTFLHSDGEAIVANGAPLKIEDDFHVRWLPFDRRGPRLNMELSNMVVALLPALVALIATAQNAIAKAEWYTGLAAVFALGFGVDQLKNLITSPPKQS